MSTSELLAELQNLDQEDLPNLDQGELLRIQAGIEELSPKIEKLRRKIQIRIEELRQKKAEEESVWTVLQEFAGAAKGLPSDLAANHDHYLYGTPKRAK